jgi:hypothetical protein
MDGSQASLHYADLAIIASRLWTVIESGVEVYGVVCNGVAVQTDGVGC